MDKTSGSSKPEIRPSAFLAGARQYRDAANRLADGGIKGDPTYMLYLHAAELALKAFLRHTGISTAILAKKGKGFGHDVQALHAAAIARGLSPEAELAPELMRVMQLLQSGNKDDSFRYWTDGETHTAEISWAGRVVNELVDLVEDRLTPAVGLGYRLIEVPVGLRVQVVEARAPASPVRVARPKESGQQRSVDSRASTDSKQRTRHDKP